MRKKILTIDGGGIKGVFPASFLATVVFGTTEISAASSGAGVVRFLDIKIAG